MRTLGIALFVTALTAGCGPKYVPVSAHTIDVSEHVEKDVIWVLRDGDTLVRCTTTEKGAVCAPAHTE